MQIKQREVLRKEEEEEQKKKENMIFQKMNKYAYDVAPSGPALQHLLTSPTHLEGSNQRGATPTCRHRNSEIASHRHPSALAFTQSPIIQQPLLMLIPHDVFMEQRPSPSACYGNYSTSIFIFIVVFFFKLLTRGTFSKEIFASYHLRMRKHQLLNTEYYTENSEEL